MTNTCIVWVVIETVRYTYRLRPGAEAERALLGEWHRCRYLWNEAVHQDRSRHKPTLCKLSKLLTDARARSPWLRDGSQVAQQQTLRTYAQALGHSFKVKGRRRPTIKPRKTTQPSLEYTVRGFSIRDNRLRLPKGVTIPVVWSRDLPSDQPRSGCTGTASGTGTPRSSSAATSSKRPPLTVASG
jgi:putative transposase